MSCGLKIVADEYMHVDGGHKRSPLVGYLREHFLIVCGVCSAILARLCCHFGEWVAHPQIFGPGLIRTTAKTSILYDDGEGSYS